VSKASAFDRDPKNYDELRPRYCPELFNDVMTLAGVGPGTSALEIGVGTGQATLPFLKRGCRVTAVEMGEHLAQYVAMKYRDAHFSVVQTTFESYVCPPSSFDLVYAATAFHWISPEVGYPKVMELLKPGGWAAFFWNCPHASREDDPVHRGIQKVYAKYRPGGRPSAQNVRKYAAAEEYLKNYGFHSVAVKQYFGERRFGPEEYIRLLRTYSDHNAMEETVRLVFEREIMAAIEDGGGVMTVHDTMELYMGQKAAI
jgi:SAM-dependent methyltransferase